MFDREHFEAREARDLAPYAMRAADSQGRLHSEAEHPLRTAFQRDRDRIVHSKAFRRLEYKTQVFVNHEGDHFRTRLTHTLEVAQIARTIARILGANEDLCEAIALAHDLGHTAFGHSGEDALKTVMAEHGGFEHNRQGLRIVDVLERAYPDFRGLNLTREVRQSILKHPSPGRAEDEALIGMIDGRRMEPLLEAQIVDHADSIAYVHHDLDDGLRAGIFAESTLVSEVELWSEAAAMVERERKGLDPSMKRKTVIRALIDATVRDLVLTTSSRLVEFGATSPRDVRAAGRHIVAQSEAVARKKAELVRFLYKHFYHHHSLVRMSLRASRILQPLFHAYVETPTMLSPFWQSWVDEVGRERAVCDYLAGMTDRMASVDHERLFLQ